MIKNKKPIDFNYSQSLYFFPTSYCVRRLPECRKLIIKNKKIIYEMFIGEITCMRLSSKPLYITRRTKMLLEDGLESIFHRL